MLTRTQDLRVTTGVGDGVAFRHAPELASEVLRVALGHARCAWSLEFSAADARR